MRKKLFWICVVLVIVCMDVMRAHATKIEVFVSILPQVYFVERIADSLVGVNVLVLPGQSPATYEPTPRQMALLEKTEIYFRIGTPFEESFIEKIAHNFPNLTIIDTRKNVPLLYFEGGGLGTTPDPHIWLDPKRVKIQATTICNVLARVDPKNASQYRRNLVAFHSDLDRIDAKIASILKPLKGSKLYVFHPAFGYFAQSYGLQQIAVETGGKEPSPKKLARLIDGAKKDGVKVIFVQPQFSRRYAEVIAREIGGAVVPIDPLPQDYMKNLQSMTSAIRSALIHEEKTSASGKKNGRL